jgi:hypothetical protein
MSSVNAQALLVACLYTSTTDANLFWSVEVANPHDVLTLALVLARDLQPPP